MVELLLILAAAAAAAAALAGLGYLLVWFLLHGRRDGPGWEKLEGFRYAHRGLHGPGVPENSLAAFRRAAEAGYGAELDVHLTRDGRLVVIHDGDLERMCGVPGRVAEKTAEELAALRLAGSEEHIPLLEEVLPLFAGRAPLVVELKTDRHGAAALARDTVDCLDRLALTNLFYNAFTRPDFVAYRFGDREKPAVRLCRKFGMRMAYWTLRSRADVALAEQEGALPIFEEPDRPKEVTH